MLGGIAVLLGWMFDIPSLTQPIPTVASMKVNTAIGLALAGLCLRLRVAGIHPYAAVILGCFVVLLGVITLSQDVFGYSAGIDELLARDPGAVSTFSPGRMSPTTAFCFALLGTALMTTTRDAPAWLSQGPAITAMFVAGAAVVGYLYDFRALYGVGIYTTMAVHTSILLLALSIGVVCARPAAGVMRVIVSPEIEGVMTRRFLLVGVTTPVLLGAVLLSLTRFGVGSEFTVALMAIGTMIGLSFVVLRNGHSLGDLRRRSEADLRGANENLKQEVARQTGEIARREKEYRLVVEEANDAFVAMDAHGHIIDVNGRTEDMFGWTREQLVGQLVSDRLMPSRHRDAHIAALQQFRQGGAVPLMGRELQSEGLRHDGHEFPVSVSISSVWLDEKWRFNAFMRDLTKPQAAARELKEALLEKEALLREVHHRVKNNLQVISSLLRLQSRALLDPGAIRALRESEERVVSMAMLHEHLHGPAHLGRVDFGDYLRVLTAELLRAYEGTDGRITITTDVTLPELNLDQAIPLALIINELLTNALKHAFTDRDSGRIDLHISHESERAILRVKDDGRGFRPEGWGSRGSIGLEIVEALSRQVGGTFSMGDNGGTEFSLVFPVPDPANA